MSNELDNFIKVDADEIFVPEGRFRPLNMTKVKEIAKSIEAMDKQLQPIIIDKNKNLIDGNHRLSACLTLNRQVVCQVENEYDEDLLSLMEIDSNLMRQELSPTELENHLAERKRIYLKMFPDTAKGKKGEGKSFVEDTAEKTGKSKRTIERVVRRGEKASPELQEARDKKEIATRDMDKIISDVGEDAEKQKEALKNLLKTKKTDVSKDTEEDTSNKQLEKLTKEIEQLKLDNVQLTEELDKAVKARDRYKTRIANAKSKHPDIKI